MNGTGGPPRSIGEQAEQNALTKILQEMKEQRELDRQEIHELKGLVNSLSHRLSHAPQPVAQPVSQGTDIQAMLFKSMLDTNQILLTKALERPAPAAPVSPLADPVVQELMRTKEDMLKLVLGQGPAAPPAEDSPAGKIQKATSRLIDKHLDDLLEGRTTKEESGGALDKLLDIAERTGTIDKFVEAATDRIKKGGEKKEARERSQLRRPNSSNAPGVPAANQPRQVPPQPEPKPLQPESSDISISKIATPEDMLVAVAAAIRDNMPAKDFAAELSPKARGMLRELSAERVMSVLRTVAVDVPILKSTRARQWVEAVLKEVKGESR